MAKTEKQPGRPPGSPNITEAVEVHPSRCKKCGSTERSPCERTTVQAYAGIRDGLPFTHIVRRRCRCKTCKQVRIDMVYENRTAVLGVAGK